MPNLLRAACAIGIVLSVLQDALAGSAEQISTRMFQDPGAGCPHVDRSEDRFAPERGCSLFDRLFASSDPGRGRDIPVPFESFLRAIKVHLPENDGSARTSLKTVLIPIGRSLQRDAAAPDFYKYPRIVAAFDTLSRSKWLMKDRLFLGYQERAAAIEIISWSEDTGRFEFQVIEDYAPGLVPSVHYANRAVCTSCHQNGAAIFPVSSWQETNINRDVAKKIGEFHNRFHGLEIAPEHAGAGFIDASAARANLFAIYQKIWREGCHDRQDDGLARRCRAGVFLSALKLRFSVLPIIDRQDPLYRDFFEPVSRRNWENTWPEGIRIQDSNIVDRVIPDGTVNAAVHYRHDPLNPRPPVLIWRGEKALDRIIEGLAERSLAEHDLVALDDRLATLAGISRATPAGPCKLKFEGADNRTEVALDCQLENSVDGVVYDLFGELTLRTNGHIGAPTNWMKFGVGGAFGDLRVANGSGRAANGAITFIVARRYGPLRPRLPNGSALGRVRIRWPDDVVDKSGAATKVHGVGTIEIVDDFQVVERALYSLIETDSPDRGDRFGDSPFRGSLLIRSIINHIDNPEGDSSREPKLVAGTTPRVQQMTGNDDSPLIRYCGRCHSGDTTVPPGFLNGEPEAIEAKLNQCAPRMAIRLSMWRRRPDERIKAPMPPPNVLAEFGYSHDDWLASDALTELIETLARYAGAGADPGTVEEYETLAPCLALTP